MVRLLVTGAVSLTPELRTALEETGAEITFVQNELAPLEIDPAPFEGVVCNALFLHNDIRRFTALRFIQVTSAGLDRLPVGEIAARGIRLFNARGVYSVPMAEWAVGKVLELYKHAPFFQANQQRKAWTKDRTVRELAGAHAAVVGFGSVGRETALRLAAFGVRLTAVDICEIPDYPFCPFDALERLLPDIDIVVLTLPLTPETRGIFDERMFRHCKRGAVLVNISRGGVIREADLVEALRSGILSGAALDVFEQEPLPADSPLWSLENVLVTPHNSFVSDRNAARLAQCILTNFQAYCHAR